MNLDEAVKKHIEWRAKFRLAIVKKEQMDAATIGKDNCCEVGKWLHGEGKSRWGSKPEFLRALDRHKAFHAEAGKVAQLINAQKYTEADAAIGNGTAFENVSKEVSTALIFLKKAAGI
jgi:methyl-accepting chemotaxis protein